MDFSLAYLVRRFFYRIFDFFHHWYVDGSRIIAGRFISILEKLDKVLALRITLRYFFQPLYKDYSIIGRILGVIFRSVRILIAAAIYLAITFFALCIYLIWLLIPLFVAVSIIRGL